MTVARTRTVRKRGPGECWGGAQLSRSPSFGAGMGAVVRFGACAVVTLLLCHCGADDDDDGQAGSSALAGAGAGGMTAPTGGQVAPAAGVGGTSGSAGTTPIGTAGTSGSAGSGAAGSAGSVAPFDAGMSTKPDAGPAPDGGPPDAGSAPDAGPPDAGPDEGAGGRGEEPPLSPVYRVALRVHRGDSAMSEEMLLDVLDEMNWIWWSQAAVCFEIEIVDGQQTMSTGFDFWFHRTEIPCSPGANGVYCGDHDIHSLDRPSLGAVDNDEWDTELNPSRTSAHELGHGLNLDHFNGFADSNDSLMSSGRQGFKLHDAEITTARNRARMKALADTAPLYCSPPKVP